MSLPITFQRLEGAAIFVAATYVYFWNGFSLVVYLLLILAFDISMVGYLVDRRVGAVVYNLGHSLIAPSILCAAAIWSGSNSLLGLTCLWIAHIGLDRALGYGLKFTKGFDHTHLGDIGKK